MAEDVWNWLNLCCRRPRVQALGLGLGVFLVLFLLRQNKQLEGLELVSYDILYTFPSQAFPEQPPITLVWFNDEDQRKYGWPLPDREMTTMLNTILTHHPRVIGLDIYRDLAVPSADGSNHVQELNQLFRDDPRIIGIQKLSTQGRDHVNPPPGLIGTGRIGFNDVLSDAGIVRRGLLFSDDGQNDYIYFGLLLALKYLEPYGIGLSMVDEEHPAWVGLGRSMFKPLDPNFGGYSNIDAAGYQFMFNFPGAPRPFESVSITQVLDGSLDPALFNARVVIIGVNAEATPDFVYTPFSRWDTEEKRVHGAAIHAYAVRQFLDMAQQGTPLIRSLSELQELMLLLISCLLASQLCLLRQLPFKLGMHGVVVIALLLAGYGAFQFYWWLPFTLVALGYGLTALATERLLVHQEKAQAQQEALQNLQLKLKEMQKVADLTETFRKFVPRQFLHYLQREDITQVRLGDHIERPMTIMFSDIRDFTTLSESLTPRKTFELVNAYLSRMGPLIRQHNGFIDKYIGDAIMALFEKPHDAVRAAIAMVRELEQFNQERLQRNEFELQIGIGVNTGKLMLGTIGEEDRMDSTVISDAVNLAARMEGLTKQYHCPLLITDGVLFQLPADHGLHIRLLDKVTVKGKKEPSAVFEVLEANNSQILQSRIQTLRLFEEAVSLYFLGQFEDAHQLFRQCLEMDANDRVLELYIDRCRQNRYTSNKSWNGVSHLKQK